MNIVFLTIFLISFPIVTQANFDIDNNSINISFIKQNYQSDEPIDVELSIENIGTNQTSFILSDILDQSIYFELRTSRNELVNLNNNTIIRLTGNFSNPAYYRTVQLMPGESFSKIINLRELYNVKGNETYLVKGIFYPNPDNKDIFIQSDYTSFSHTPPPLILKKIVDESIKRTEQLTEISNLLPNEIVQGFFEAQFEKDWDKFLLYINAERLIYAFRNFSIQYNESTDGMFRIELIEKFKKFFTIHWNIPLISYKIIETVIKEDTAIVTVDALESIRFTSRKIRYNFILYRTNTGLWLISDYTILVLN